MRRAAVLWSLLVLQLLLGCASAPDDAQRLAESAPLDLAVMVSGGAFLGAPVPAGTFAERTNEAIPLTAVRDLLTQGRAFHRVAIDPDEARRRRLRDRLRDGPIDDEVMSFMAAARQDGFDVLLLVEALQDGPIDVQGTNGRWPVTFATWILLGVGALIPDRTFESRATLRVTVRDLQTGAALHDPPLLTAGPVDLSLVERTDFLGLLTSAVVPPFWVGDDAAAVATVVRETTERRLLLSLVRDLKSDSVRQRLRERSAAAIDCVDRVIIVEAGEGVTVARLRGASLSPAAVSDFERRLLASASRSGARYRYRAELPPLAAGDVQVLVGTLRGAEASATFAVGSAP